MGNGRQEWEDLRELLACKIAKEKEAETLSYVVGKWREDLFEEALKNLLSRKEITGYKKTDPLSYDNIKKGIDFYVVREIYENRYSRRVRRFIRRFSITGPDFVEEQKEKYSRNIVLGIHFKNTAEEMEEIIMFHFNSRKA